MPKPYSSARSFGIGPAYPGLLTTTIVLLPIGASEVAKKPSIS